MKNELHTISIGQTTHQDAITKSGLRRILFDKSCLRCFLFHENVASGAFFSFADGPSENKVWR